VPIGIGSPTGCSPSYKSPGYTFGYDKEKNWAMAREEIKASGIETYEGAYLEIADVVRNEYAKKRGEIANRSKDIRRACGHFFWSFLIVAIVVSFYFIVPQPLLPVAVLLSLPLYVFVIIQAIIGYATWPKGNVCPVSLSDIQLKKNTVAAVMGGDSAITTIEFAKARGVATAVAKYCIERYKPVR
jgi:hypothetical protein